MTQNGLTSVLKHETIWMDAHRYQDAERQYQEYCAKRSSSDVSSVKSHVRSHHASHVEGKPVSSLVSDIVNAREKIKNILSGDVKETNNSEIVQRLQKLSDENKEMRKTMSEMSSKIKILEDIMREITLSKGDIKVAKPESVKPLNAAKQNGPSAADDDDVDLFGSDEENEDDARIREERLKAYENKKSKKPALIAKSSVVLDVKPWDDETDMKALEEAVRSISTEGLKWGAGKLVPLAYGIKKLQLVAIVEDDKVSIDWLQEAIQEHEDLVQSVDIAAFNKL
nr:elongation factor 1-beta' isoform X1 [Parasteatoda tepidariorum]